MFKLSVGCQAVSLFVSWSFFIKCSNYDLVPGTTAELTLLSAASLQLLLSCETQKALAAPGQDISALSWYAEQQKYEHNTNLERHLLIKRKRLMKAVCEELKYRI